MTEDDATLVEAVLNIVRMELDTSGAVVAIKKELDKSVKLTKMPLLKSRVDQGERSDDATNPKCQISG